LAVQARAGDASAVVEHLTLLRVEGHPAALGLAAERAAKAPRRRLDRKARRVGDLDDLAHRAAVVREVVLREGVQHPGIATRGEVGHVASYVPGDPYAEVRAACARRACWEGHLGILAHLGLMVNTTYAFTAPAVSPNVMRRCTSRKKTTTRIAVRVEPAISAPQS